uniref:Uncharacterized protein n=1 Tax=viral metagenome TaxID=1070528 RepID=A0A6C0B772_9ZZZZ
MSAANAAARKRRTTPDPAPSVMNRPGQFGNQTPASSTAQPNGLTLPQVIALIDNRLVKLEEFMKESNNSVNSSTSTVRNKELEITNNDIMLQEFDKRFEILAEEINNLKDMLLKLQSYTMDVNRTLIEERVRVLSDLGGNEDTTFPANIFNSRVSLDDESSGLDLRNLAETELNQ